MADSCINIYPCASTARWDAEVILKSLLLYSANGHKLLIARAAPNAIDVKLRAYLIVDQTGCPSLPTPLFDQINM